MELKIIKLPHSEVEITGEISQEALKKHRKQAVKNLQKEIKLDGFREGSVPESILVSRLGETAILEEAAEIALQDEYKKILSENDLRVIGRPQVILTKVTSGAPAEFKIHAALLPEIKIGDYIKIAEGEMQKENEKIEITERDVEDVIEELRQLRSKRDAREAGKPETEVSAEGLQPFDDAFVKTLGDFKDVADFREKAKKNLAVEKEMKARDKKRIVMVEKILEKSEIDLPEILIESELEKMMDQFESDITRAGVKMDDYLTHLKKTQDDFRKEWRNDAEKRAKVQLIFNEIAKREKLVPDAKKVATEAAYILERYKDAKPESVKIYVETILTNDLVFEFLEGQK